jgi:hypothetical protein
MVTLEVPELASGYRIGEEPAAAGLALSLRVISRQL